MVNGPVWFLNGENTSVEIAVAPCWIVVMARERMANVTEYAAMPTIKSAKLLAYVRQCHDCVWKVLDIVDPEGKPHTGDCLVVAGKWIEENKPNE